MCLLVVNVVEAAGIELILNAPTLWSQPPDKNSKATIHSKVGGLVVIVVILKLKLGFYSGILVFFSFLSFLF